MKARTSKVRPHTFLGALCFFLFASACALTNKADPLNLRYFAPYNPNQTQSRSSVAGQAEPTTVRMDGVEAATHLTEAIVYRKSEAELAYYEDMRWTETPNVYVDRAIGDALFRDGSLRRGLTEGAYSLAVTLEAFDELKFDQPRVRVVTRVWIGDERIVLSERRLVVEEPIGDPSGEPNAAMMKAFTQALNQTAQQIRTQLEETMKTARVNEQPDVVAPEPEATVVP